jgi:Mn2+/Fe2+ NRAMP family transporter
VTFQRSRRGTAEDRGKVVRFPLQERTRKLGFWANLRRLVPGIVTGAANVDPSLVITATVAGAAFGFGLLWVVVLCVPFLEAIFGASARLGYETRKGLVDLLRENYGRRVALACAAVVILINMAMIIADLMAVSDSLSIILGHRRIYFVAVVAFSVWYILIFRNYRKVTDALLWLSLPLFVYVAAAVVSAPRPAELLYRTFVPRVSPTSTYAAAVLGMFGSLLTPYVLVWQTSSRREHAVTGGDRPHSFESHAGTLVTTVLSFSVLVAAASVLHLRQPIEMTTRQAALALQPAVGPLGPALFAIGILGAGMVALPVLLASMCYSVSESMGWRSGLSENPWEAKSFYVLISLSMLVAAVGNFIRINPVKALFLSQVLAGVLTVPILVFILLLSNDRRIMQTTNSRYQNFWIGAAIGGLVATELLWVWWGLVRAR